MKYHRLPDNVPLLLVGTDQNLLRSRRQLDQLQSQNFRLGQTLPVRLTQFAYAHHGHNDQQQRSPNYPERHTPN